MSLESYFVFIGASILLCIAPGPDMLFLLGRTLAQGRKAGVLAAIGINLGAYVHMLAAVFGISAILATSSFAFAVLKWIGAAYLVYLGIRVLMSRQSVLHVAPQEGGKSKWSILWQGFLSDVLNPKVAIFFLAFLPQFVDADSPDRTWQVMFLGCTVNVIAICINLLIVYGASFLTAGLRRNQRISAWLNKIMGGVFIGLGLRLANEKL